MLYIFGEYALDTQRHTLQRAGQNIPVRRKVFQALTYLLVHHDRAVSKHELCAHVWPEQFISETALESTIKAVRQAIGDSGREQQRLQTVYGHGYRFIAAVQVHPDVPPGTADEDRPAPSDPVPAPSQAPHNMPFMLPRQGAAEDDDVHWTIPTTAEERLSPRDTISPAEEHKPVTVLCCALAQPTALATRMGPEAMHHLMQAVFTLAQEVVQRYEGTIAQFGGDGFQALFGAAVAQEDHARRAVLAAVDVHQQLDERLAANGQPLGDMPDVCIGLHSGVAVVGRLGDDPRRIYTAVGETTVLASRLQHMAAPGTILLSAATWQLVQDEVQVEPAAAVAVEDSSTPVPVYVFCSMARRRGVTSLGGRGRWRSCRRAWRGCKMGVGRSSALPGSPASGSHACSTNSAIAWPTRP